MQTSTPPPSTFTPSPAIGLEQFEQFAAMLNSYSAKFALMKNSNDWIGLELDPKGGPVLKSRTK